MTQQTYGIGVLASQSGVSEANIRYYEQIGLLPAARRGSNGHRRYCVEDLERLILVKHCRNLGFPINQVRHLLRLAATPDCSCIETHRLALEQLAIVRSKVAKLCALEAELSEHIRNCEATCLTQQTQGCAILKARSTGATESAPCCG